MRTTTLQGLESELAQEQAHINAAVARWLGLLAEYDDRSDVGGDRFERWVAWRFGISYWEAAELVRLARALRELPHIRDAFARGELTYTKVRALTRVATPSCEERLLSLASVLTAPQLDRALRVYQRVSTAQARRQHELEYVNYYWDDDGSLVLHARLASEDGTVLVRALNAARERIRERRRGDRPSTTGQGDATPARAKPRRFEPPRSRTVEALLDLAHRSLAAGPGSEQASTQRPRLVVRVDAATITNDAKPGRCALDDGPVISPETARRLGCDATTVTATQRNGAAAHRRPHTPHRPAKPPPHTRSARRRNLPMARLHEPPLPRRPPPPTLGPRRRHQPRQPHPPLLAPPPPRPRRLLHHRTRLRPRNPLPQPPRDPRPHRSALPTRKRRRPPRTQRTRGRHRRSHDQPEWHGRRARSGPNGRALISIIGQPRGVLRQRRAVARSRSTSRPMRATIPGSALMSSIVVRKLTMQARR